MIPSKTAMQELIEWMYENKAHCTYGTINKKAQELLHKEKEQIINAFNASEEVYPDTSRGRGVGGQTITPKYYNSTDYYQKTYNQ